MRAALAFQRFDRAELELCRLLNRSSRLATVRGAFGLVSWLGNGWLWYAAIAALPVVQGEPGWTAAAHAVFTGAIGVVVYKTIKNRAVRERPFITHTVIHCAAAPLDRYSFPSGHTLHAVSFTVLLTHYVPEWFGALAAFAVLVGLSRVVLGLHYPSDVVAGAAIGGGLAALSLQLA